MGIEDKAGVSGSHITNAFSSEAKFNVQNVQSQEIGETMNSNDHQLKVIAIAVSIYCVLFIAATLFFKGRRCLQPEMSRLPAGSQKRAEEVNEVKLTVEEADPSSSSESYCRTSSVETETVRMSKQSTTNDQSNSKSGTEPHGDAQ